MENLNINLISSESPKSWEDFLNFYKEEFNSVFFLKTIPFDQIPFEMQLGIFLKYFNKNGVELDVCNSEYEMLPSTITDAFRNFEKVISHFS